MAIFLTSDHHYGHFKIIEYCKRPFHSVSEMNEEMIRIWNETVGPDDEVYYLGDFVLNLGFLNIASRLNGKLYLVPGNHDSKVFPWNGKGVNPDNRKRYYDAGFKKILEREFTMEIGGQTVLISHFPYCEDHSEYNVRYKEYRPKSNGLYLCHGHIHEKRLKRGKEINVGCDVWNFRPVSLEQIIQVMNDPREFILNVDELNTKVL